jgi:cytidine deaminase
MASSELAPLTKDEMKSLIAKSKAAKEYAHAPYSNFQVGAALLAKDGRIFTGKMY